MALLPDAALEGPDRPSHAHQPVAPLLDVQHADGALLRAADAGRRSGHRSRRLNPRDSRRDQQREQFSHRHQSMLILCFLYLIISLSGFPSFLKKTNIEALIYKSTLICEDLLVGVALSLICGTRITGVGVYYVRVLFPGAMGLRGVPLQLMK